MKNILVKGSGDVTNSLQFFNFVVEKAHDNYVVVICGGGTKISAALEKAGYVVFKANGGQTSGGARTKI